MPTHETHVLLVDSSGNKIIVLNQDNATISTGGSGKHGCVLVRDADNNETIKLNGEAGDITLSGGDCAENFEIADACPSRKGSVLVLRDDGQLEECNKEYDRRVAGVISGAGNTRPGIVLGMGTASQSAVPVALSGRVNCRVDASHASIAVGDLLTTAATPGCAMKADDREKAFGSVIGKAMEKWSEGIGLIPVLISLR